MNDEYLRQAWQRPGGTQLDAAELAALLDGRLAPERRAAVLALVASDADAALQLQLAMDLRAAAADAVAGARVHPLPLRPAPRWLPAWLQALAACLVLALGAAVWMRPPAPEVLRSDSSTAQLAPADGAILESPPAQLHWQAQPGVGRYRVRLYDAQASLLWESAEQAQPALALDPGQREHLRSGHYYWRVEWPGGSGLGPYHFEVRP